MLSEAAAATSGAHIGAIERAIWLAPVNLRRRMADAMGPANCHGDTMRSSGSGPRTQRAQVIGLSSGSGGCSSGSAQRAQAGPSSTSKVEHGSQNGAEGAVQAAH